MSDRCRSGFTDYCLLITDHFCTWGGSSVGRAPRSQRGGHEFESRSLHPSLGKFGSDAPAPCVALYSRMRKHGNGADEPKSPQPFSNEIRTTIFLEDDAIKFINTQNLLTINN